MSSETLSPIPLNFPSRFGSKSTKPFVSTTFHSCLERLGLVGLSVQASHFSPGKSQLVGDLATRLARCCYTIHLNGNFTFDVMTRFLRGVCESNLWGFMENINLLTRSVMSVISSHFQTIKTAQTIHLREFTLDQQTTRMFPGVAFLCTENIVQVPKSISASHYSLYSRRAQFVSRRFHSRCEPSSEKPQSSFLTWRLCSVGFSGSFSFTHQSHFPLPG